MKNYLWEILKPGIQVSVMSHGTVYVGINSKDNIHREESHGVLDWSPEREEDL